MKIRTQLTILSFASLLISGTKAQEPQISGPPEIAAVERSGDNLSFSWSSLPGARYDVAFSTDLSVWRSVGQAVGTSRNSASFTDTDAGPLSTPSGFYRASLTEASLGSSLALDFTFPTTAVVDDLGQVSGMTLDGETLILLTDRPELIRMSLDGELLDRRAIQHDVPLTGLATLSLGRTLVISDIGELFIYQWSTSQLSIRGRLPQGEYGALAYHPPSRSIAGLTLDGKLIILGDDDIQGQFAKNTGLESAVFTGITTTPRSLYATAIRNDVPWLLKLSLDGELKEAWYIGGMPEALVLREEGDEGPAVLIANRDAQRTIRQYEPPQPASTTDLDPLEFIGQFELGEAAPQPSGAFFNATDGRLYFITDFGKVVSTNASGDDLQTLFEVPDSVQGTYEAIVVKDDEVWLLASDSRSPTRMEIFDRTGNQLREESINESQLTQVIEGYTVDPLSGSQWWVNHDAGESKVLKRKNPDGNLSEFSLPEEFTPNALVGLAAFGEYMIFVTDEQETDDARLAGHLVVWEWEDGEEEARFAIAVNDASGQLSGVPDPSDLAYDPERGLVFITSDTDDGEVFVFDLDFEELD